MSTRTPPDRDSIPDVDHGDFVSVKPWVFEEVRMSPCDLFKVGWPNRFMVMAVVEHEGQVLLTLDPCCHWMKNRATGAHLCTSHPARYFEKAEADTKLPNKGDRYFGIDSPWGEVASVDFMENGKDSKAVMRVLGKPFIFQGEVLKRIAQGAIDRGLL